MANGQRWQDWVGKAIACPPELPFETIVMIDGQEWICKDRGGAIVYDGNAFWIDQLLEDPQYAFGETLEAVVYTN